MPSLSYLFKRVMRLSRSGLSTRLNEVHQLTGRSKPVLFVDMAQCALKYGSGYVDYALLGMWELNSKQRKTLLTRAMNNKYVAALNNRNDWHYFENKIDFLQTFSEYIGREYLDLSTASIDEFEAFTKKHPIFIVKPVDEMCGNGIEKIDSANMELPSLLEELRQKGQTLAEELIIQHHVMSELNSSSVNTIRVATLRNDTGAHIVFTGLRCGAGDRVTDNFNSGGLTVPIDIDTGVIHHSAVTKSGKSYTHHPSSGVAFDGFTIPMWDELRSLVLTAAMRVPGIRYVGWDITITESSPILIEGNHFPDHDLYQLREHMTDKIGILPAFDRVVPYKSLKPIKP